MFDRQTLQGAYFALSAYLFWGIAPVYFKWLGHVSPFEIVAQRVIWSTVLLLGILLVMGRLDTLRLARQQWWKIVCTSALLTFNWLVFVYSIATNNIAESSLGYFINPLVSVFLGMLFLGERLRPLQWIAITIAAAGILIQLLYFGRIPFLALALAFSFGFYGLMRKNLGLHAVGGLALETLIMLPVALAWLGWLWSQDLLQFAHVDIRTDLLLVAAGLVTSFPLLCFAAAVRRLSLTAAGMFQYVSPTLSLLLAVFVYGEPFDASRMVVFGCIWLALVIFTFETVVFHRRLGRRLRGEAL